MSSSGSANFRRITPILPEMSIAGPLSVPLPGLLPLISEAIKSFQIIRAGIRTARKCAKDIEDLELSLDVQQIIFRTECLFLIQNGDQGQKVAHAMINDLSHDRWEDHSLEGHIEERSKEIYCICQRTIKGIHEIQQQLIIELQGFQEVKNLRIKVSTALISLAEADEGVAG
jgi:hypothetical protein